MVKTNRQQMNGIQEQPVKCCQILQSSVKNCSLSVIQIGVIRMEKLSDEELNDLIAFCEYSERPASVDKIMPCLLELKQLRAEKKYNVNGQGDERVA